MSVAFLSSPTVCRPFLRRRPISNRPSLPPTRLCCPRTNLALPPIASAASPSPPSSSSKSDDADLRRFAASALSLSRPLVLRATIAVSISVFCALVSPMFFGRALNRLVVASASPGRASAERFVRSLGAVVLLYLVESTAGYIYIRHMTKVVDKAVLHLRRTSFSAITAGCDASFFDAVPVETVSSALSTDTSRVRDLLWTCLQTDRGIRAAVESTLGILFVAFLSLKIAAIYMVTVPLVAGVSAFSGLKLAALYGDEAVARGRATSMARESLGAWKTVLSFGTGDREMRKYSGMLRSVDEEVSAKLRPRKALNDFYGRCGLSMILCAVVTFGGGMVALGTIPLEVYLSSQSYLWKLTFSTQGTIYTQADLSELRATLRRIYSVKDTASDASAKIVAKSVGAERPDLGRVRGHISFRNICFAYPLRPDVQVFQDLSISIAAGKTTALVGSSGSGKTTITALISRLYEPQRGAVLLDGVDVATLDRSWYAEYCVGMVSQSPVILTGELGTVREAIAYGAADRLQPVSDRVVIEAAKQANAHEFIQALPNGYDTRIGNAGNTNLSGGQIQRLAIARAIVRNPIVLLLDEATSALDNDSEAKVQQALERLTAGRTVLVVAHRLSTIRNADKVVVLGNGGVVLETGSYDELVERSSGAFSSLMETQSRTFVGE